MWLVEHRASKPEESIMDIAFCGDIWIPPKVQISNAGTQTDDNEEDESIIEEDESITSMDIEEYLCSADSDFCEFDDSTIQAQWPKETDDDSGNQDETDEEAFSFSEGGRTNMLLVPRSEGFTPYCIPIIPEDRRTHMLAIGYRTPHIKKQVTTFFKTSDSMIMGFSPQTTEELSFKYGPFNDAEIQSGTVIGFLDIQVQLQTKCQNLNLVYFYKCRTIYFLQKRNWQRRHTIYFLKQWTEEILFVQVQIPDKKTTDFQIQGQQHDYCFLPPLTCNGLVCHTFTKSRIETGIICCINSQGRRQKLKFRERSILEGNLLMTYKHFGVSLVPAKNANDTQLNQEFEFKTFALSKNLSVSVWKNRSFKRTLCLEKYTSLPHIFGGNSPHLTEFDSHSTTFLLEAQVLRFTLKNTIRSPRRKQREKERRGHDIKERNDKIKGQTKKATPCKSHAPMGYEKSRKNYREIYTPDATTLLSKPEQTYQTCGNHSMYSATNKNDTPKETVSDASLFYCFFKGGKIKAVVWQTLYSAFLFTLLLSPATGVTDKKCRGIQESARNVSMCPTTKGDMIKRAAIKNCKDFSNSCDEQLEYQCVLNDRGTGFVEVCSPAIKIIGEFCAEFNVGLGGIQPQKQKSCLGTCPFAYNSTDMYKYSSVCYKKLRLGDDIDNIKKAPKKSTTNVNITEDEKDFSLSRFNETIHLQENGTILKEAQPFQSLRSEGCSYIVIAFIAITILVFFVFGYILYFKHKNFRRVPEEISATTCTMLIHVPVEKNCAAKTMIVKISGRWNGTEVNC